MFCTQTCTHKAELLLRQQLPKQTEHSHAQQVTKQFHSVTAPKPRTELLQLPSISRGAVAMQGRTEPGRSRAWLPAQTAVTATHTLTFFKGTQKLQFSSAGAGEGKAGEALTCGNSSVCCRPQSSLCTIAGLQVMEARIAHSEDSPPGQSQNKQSFRGVCLHTPHPCTRPLSLEVKKAC